MEINDAVLRARLVDTLSEFLPSHPASDLLVETVPAYAMSMQTGLDADSFFAERDGTRYFIKLHHGELPGAADHALAANAARRAASAGIAPAVLAYLPARAATIFERAPIGWRTAMRPDFDDAEVRREAMATLRRWHGTDSVPTARPAWHFIDATFEALDIFRSGGAPGSDLVAPEDYEQLRACYSEFLAVVSTPPAMMVPLHGEVLASNMLVGPHKQVMLIDFDRVANGDPLWDLAALALAFDTPDSEHAGFLAQYMSSCGDHAVARMRANMVVQDIGWGLWGRLAHFLSPRESVEFFKYGETRLARARGRLAANAGAQP